MIDLFVTLYIHGWLIDRTKVSAIDTATNCYICTLCKFDTYIFCCICVRIDGDLGHTNLTHFESNPSLFRSITPISGRRINALLYKRNNAMSSW